MLAFVVGIVIILLIVGAAMWASRTKPTQGNGSNTDAAARYGAGPH